MEEQLGSRNRDSHPLPWVGGQGGETLIDRARQRGRAAGKQGDWELERSKMEIQVPEAAKEEVKSINP